MLDSNTTPRILAKLLKVNYAQLIVTAYKESGIEKYETFEISKKNGDVRTICAPTPKLKNIQSRLKELLEEIYTPHNAASAFICGRGLIYNAKRHVKQSSVFNIDLKGFFDQINFGRVRGLLMSKPYSIPTDTATIIANICCLENKLPQGAPTSPIISNMICKKLDRQLSQIAMENRAQYTRYADDITFSFKHIRPQNIFVVEDGVATPTQELVNLIRENGFEINDTKTRLHTSNKKQVVTGLIVNQKVNIDRRYIRTTRAMIYSLSQGVEQANVVYLERNPESKSTLEDHVAGRISYIGMIKGRNSSVFISLANLFNHLGLNIHVALKAKLDKIDLDRELHFRTPDSKKRLNETVWIVDFEGVEGADEYIQGSAFTLKGTKIFSCAHVFKKAGVDNYCFLCRITDRAKKYKANVIHINYDTDIVVMKFEQTDLTPSLPYLEIAHEDDIGTGYQVSVVGFPEFAFGHTEVTAIPAKIISERVISAVDHYEVDKDIRSGNSGGPVLNAYMQVIGMASRGRSLFVDVEASINSDNQEKIDVKSSIEESGVGSFISAKHFRDLLKTP